MLLRTAILAATVKEQHVEVGLSVRALCLGDKG